MVPLVVTLPTRPASELMPAPGLSGAILPRGRPEAPGRPSPRRPWSRRRDFPSSTSPSGRRWRHCRSRRRHCRRRRTRRDLDRFCPRRRRPHRRAPATPPTRRRPRRAGIKPAWPPVLRLAVGLEACFAGDRPHLGRLSRRSRQILVGDARRRRSDFPERLAFAELAIDVVIPATLSEGSVISRHRSGAEADLRQYNPFVLLRLSARTFSCRPYATCARSRTSGVTPANGHAVNAFGRVVQDVGRCTMPTVPSGAPFPAR